MMTKPILFFVMLAAASSSSLLAQSSTAPVVVYQVASSWGTGLTANVQISNPGSTAINNWTLQCSYANSISSIWDASIASHAGTVYTLAHAAYNASIPAGGSVTFGFTANGTSSGSLTGCLVNGAATAPAPPPPPPVSTLPPTVTYQVTSNWGTGLNATVTIANPNQTAISNWQMQFTYPYTITNIYNATIAARTGNQYTVNNAGWNASIPAAGSVSFGFSATIPGGAAGGPSACLVNGFAVSSASCPLSVPTASDTTPPSVPTNLKATVQSTGNVLLQWDPSTDTGSGVASYTILRNDVSFATTPATQYTVTGLAPSTAYKFSVLAVDKAGNQSHATSNVNVTTPAAGCGAIPAAPTSPVVNSGTSSSITVSWTAPTAPQNCAVTYTLYNGGVVAATGVTGTTYQFTGLQATTSYSFGIAAVDQVGSSSETFVKAVTKDAPVTQTPSAWPAKVFAPYVDMSIWPTTSLSSLAAATGQKYYTMGYVRSQSSNECQAAWGGLWPVASSFLDDLKQLRAAGGDVIVSFGGDAGSDLAQSCGDVNSLAAQYRQVIAAIGATRLDFDVEGGALADPVSISRRNQAIAVVQAEAAAQGKTLLVQYTLPAMPTGLDANGLGVLSSAKSAGVSVAVVNILAMDYGAGYSGSHMGDYAIQAATSLYGQLTTVYGAASMTDAQRWRMIGVTPMIGMNDVTDEVFSTQDARTVETWAAGHQIGLISMLSANRDAPCVGGGVSAGYVSTTCSSTVQSAHEFTSVFLPFSQ